MAPMTALVQRTHEGKRSLSQETIDRPTPTAHQVLIEISHAAQNPTDIQSFDRGAFANGAVFGCDFVGTVAALGPDVATLREGDTVAALVWGGEIGGLGAFAEYCLADERIAFRVPEGMGRAEASTVPLAAATAWLALFSTKCLGVDRGRDGGKTVLVWGGSSSVGLYAIQLAVLQGLRVITTCSPRNFDLVQSVGAQHYFDYMDPDVVEKIRGVDSQIEFVFDTIGNTISSNTASHAVRQAGGGLCTVRPGKAFTDKVTKQTKVTDVLVWTAFYKDHRYGDFFWPADKGDHELGVELFQKIPGWLEKGQLVPNKPSLKKGLDAVEEGFQEYRDGMISAYKIVYEL